MSTSSAGGEPDSGEPDTDAEVAISFRDVGKRFDDEWILEHIDLSVPRGTIVGLIGPSGCGKTSTVRLATGYYRPDAGEVEFLGSAPSELSRSQRTELGYLPQHPVLFDDLSLRDNLHFHASLNGVPFRRRERLDELLELVELTGDDGKLVSAASGGMQRRLALAATLVHAPRILILDEPTAGIDPILRRRFWDHFRELRDGGTTLVICTQYVGEAADCDMVAMLAHGRVAAVGTPHELFRRAYGGALYDLDFTADIRAEAVREIRTLDGVAMAQRTADRVVRVSSELPGTEVQHLVEEKVPSNEVCSLTTVPPDWDDVFIQLVDRPADEPEAPAEIDDSEESSDESESVDA